MDLSILPSHKISSKFWVCYAIYYFKVSRSLREEDTDFWSSSDGSEQLSSLDNLQPKYPRTDISRSFFLRTSLHYILGCLALHVSGFLRLRRIYRGQRREGIFSAISGWIMKAGSSLTFGLSGVLLAWTLSRKV